MKKSILSSVFLALFIVTYSFTLVLSKSLSPLHSISRSPTMTQLLNRQLKGNLTIDKAVYGTNLRWLDVTKNFRALIKPSDRKSGDWLFYSESAIWYQIGDPASGEEKQLLLDYTLDGVKHHEVYIGGKFPTMIKINLPYPQDLSRNNWTLIKAEYGLRGHTVINVTELLKQYIIYGELDWCPWDSNEAFGDPTPGYEKFVYVDYVFDGVSHSIKFGPESKEWIRIHGNVKDSTTPTPTRQLMGNLTIDKAIYGSDTRWLDVTKNFRALLKPSDRVSGDWLFYSESAIWYQMGDPVSGENKQLLLDYTLNGIKYHHVYNTGQLPTMIKINLPYPQDLSKNNWTLLKAEYGVRGQKVIDVTDKLKQYIFYNELVWIPWDSNEAFGDPLPGVIKSIYLDYVIDGVSYSIKYGTESKEWIRIPSHTKAIGLLNTKKVTNPIIVNSSLTE